MMKVCIVAAMDANGAIGSKGTLPWHCPIDMRHFRGLTLGRVCLMGRKTAESLKKPLRDRVNLVLTRDRTWSKAGFITVHSKRDIKRELGRFEQRELWVIGGAAIYKKFLPIADVVHLTVLDIVVPDADTWFPVQGLERFGGMVVQSTADPKVNFWVFTPQAQTASKRPKSTSMECDW